MRAPLASRMYYLFYIGCTLGTQESMQRQLEQVCEGGHTVEGDVYQPPLRRRYGVDVESEPMCNFALGPSSRDPSSTNIPTEHFTLRGFRNGSARGFWLACNNPSTSRYCCRRLCFDTSRHREIRLQELVQGLTESLCECCHSIDRNVLPTFLYGADITRTASDLVAKLRLIPSHGEPRSPHVAGEYFAFGRFVSGSFRRRPDASRRLWTLRRTPSHAWFLARQRSAPRSLDSVLRQDSPPAMAVKTDSHMNRESVSLSGVGLKTASNRMKALRGFAVASIMRRGPLGPLSTYPADQRQRRTSKRLP